MQVCKHLPGIVDFPEVQDFFTETWAPILQQLHAAGNDRDVLESFLTQLIQILRPLKQQEVCYINFCLFNHLKPK